MSSEKEPETIHPKIIKLVEFVNTWGDLERTAIRSDWLSNEAAYKQGYKDSCRDTYDLLNELEWVNIWKNHKENHKQVIE